MKEQRHCSCAEFQTLVTRTWYVHTVLKYFQQEAQACTRFPGTRPGHHHLFGPPRLSQDDERGIPRRDDAEGGGGREADAVGDGSGNREHFVSCIF